MIDKEKRASQDTVRVKDEIDLLEIISILLRFKWLIVTITTVAAVIVVIFLVITMKMSPDKSPLPNIYRPAALILINEDTSSTSSLLSSSGLGSLAGLAGISGGTTYGALAEKIVRSNSTIDIIVEMFDVINRYDITKHPIGSSRKEVNSHLGVDYDVETSTLTISYEDYDPVYARDIVNQIVTIMVHRFSAIGSNKNLTRKNLLEQKLSEVETEIASLESSIRQFQEKHGALDVETLAKEQVSALAELKSELFLKDMEIKTYSGFTSIDDPAIRRMKAARENLAKLINEMESGYSEYEPFMLAQEDLPALAIEFEHFKRNLQVQTGIYQILIQQYELAKLNVEGEDQIFQTLELADIPDLKAGPSRSTISITTTVAAFLFSIMLAFIISAIQNIRNDSARIN